MRYVMLFMLICFSLHTNEHPKKLYLTIGYVSEIRLPEPFIKVLAPVPVIEVREIEGMNKKVLVVQLLTSKKGESNLRIYSAHYSFNIKVIINDSRYKPTSLLRLDKNINDLERLDNMPSTKMQGQDSIRQITPTLAQHVFRIDSLLKVKDDLLKPNRYCYSIRKSRVIFAVDYVFYHKDKIVFKCSVYNRSQVPYRIADLTVLYKEYKGFIFQRRETVRLDMKAFYEEYSDRLISGWTVGHIIYVAEKMGVKDEGNFAFILREDNGNRTIQLEIPSFIQ